MDQLDLAVHNTAHNGGDELSVLAKKIGVGEQVLRNKCNPNAEFHKLSLREALALMIHSSNTEILEVLAAELGCRVYAAPDDCLPGDLISAVLAATAEQGDVSSAIQEALSDNIISLEEEARINREISEAIDSLHKLKRVVGQKAKSHLKTVS